MKAVIVLLVFCVILSSCGKSGNVQINLTGTLTECPVYSTCTYKYYDNAGFQDWSRPVAGQDRVFWYKNANNDACDPTTEIYFEAPVNSDIFEINSSEIAAGRVSGYVFSCTCCLTIPNVKLIGGEIKGKRTDAAHWLVNASLIIGTSGNVPVDTLIVNQYFTRQPLP